MPFYCIFTAQYLPTIGGVENYSQNLAVKLKSRGNRVAIITSALDGLPETEIDLNGIEIIRLPSKQLLNGRLPVVLPGKRTAKLLQPLLSTSGCRVIVNTRFYPLSLYATRLAKKFGRNCIVIEHGSAHLSLGNTAIDFAVKLYEHIVCSFVKRYCKNFYAVSSRSRDWLLHFGITAKGIIFNAIDTTEVDSVPAELFKRNNYNITQEKNIICYIGRMIPEKGVVQLIDAFNEISSSHPAYTLVMAGDGPLLELLKKRANGSIVFCGRLDRNSCVALLKQAQIFCLPTVSEGFSTTLLEAAAASCYIITTQTCGGADEVLEGADNGTIIKGGTIPLIKAAITAAIDDSNLKQKTAIVRNRVEMELGWDNSCNIVEEIGWQD